MTDVRFPATYPIDEKLEAQLLGLLEGAVPSENARYTYVEAGVFVETRWQLPAGRGRATVVVLQQDDMDIKELDIGVDVIYPLPLLVSCDVHYNPHGAFAW